MMNRKQITKTIQKKPPIVKGIQLNKQPKSFKYTNILGIAIIILLGIIIYSNSFKCVFHFDDLNSIINNSAIQDLSNIKAWWNYSSNRPVGYFTFAVNYHYGQLNVWGYHLVNLIIHLSTACIVMWLTQLIFSTPALKDSPISKHKKTLALLTALLFVSHPLATQSVTYIVQRMASMVAMFYLLSIALYVKGRLLEKGGTKYFWFVGALVSAVLALLTKENAYTLPFAIMLVEIFFLQRKKFVINFKDYRIILVIIAFLSIIILMFYRFSLNIFNSIPPKNGNDYTITSTNYLLTQFSVIVKYIQLLFLPINQSVDHNIPLSTCFFEIRTLLSFLFLLSLVILAILLFKRNRLVSFGIFWFFLTLIIESSIIPIDDIIFEHRTYLPSFGFFLILSSIIYILFWKKNKYLALSIFLSLILLNSVLTFQRNKIWKDDITLWNDVISKSPEKPRPYVVRGFVNYNLGQMDNAISDFSKAIELNPKYKDAYNNRSIAYCQRNQFDKAIGDYTKAIDLDPLYTAAYYNRGIAYENLKQWDKALIDFTKAIELNPIYAEAYCNRGVANRNLGNVENAIADYSKAIEINSTYNVAYSNRGIVYDKLEKWDKAISDYTKAIELDPKVANVYYNRGNSYSKKGEWDKAINDYSKTIEIDSKFAKAYYNRANIYVKLEQWDNAISDYTKTIEINPEDKLAYSNREFAYSKLNNKDKKR